MTQSADPAETLDAAAAGAGAGEALTPPDASADAARLRILAEELAGVERALHRLDEGTYGTCEVCGVRLDDASLEAGPAQARCGAHGQPDE